MAEPFVLKIPLHTNPRDEEILEQRRRARAQLKAAALRTARARARSMRRDPAFKKAAKLPAGTPGRQKAFDEIHAKYELRGDIDVQKLTQDHWRSSRWMPLVIDSRVGDAIAREVWAEIKAWLFGARGEPRPKEMEAQNTIWGWGNAHGLRWSEKEEAIIWPQPGRYAPPGTTDVYNLNRCRRGEPKRKKRGRRRDLRLELKRRLGPGSRYWETRVGERRIVRVGLKREMTRKGWEWFALFCIEGEPYRNPDRARQIEAATNGPVGIDVNVSNFSVVSAAGSTYVDLAPDPEKARLEQQRRRRRQRALERSRRANSGRTSKRAERLQRGLTATQRRDTENRRREAVQTAQRLLVEHGANVVTEGLYMKPWQRRWGKRIGFTRPSDLFDRIEREAGLHGGQVERIPIQLALSQTCLCGQRKDKDADYNTHECLHCGLGPVDRDLLSAALAYLVGVLGQQDFCAAVNEGTLAEAWAESSGVDEWVVAEITAPPSRAPSPSRRLTTRKTRKCPLPRALDGLSSATAADKVAHSGSKLSGQTDGTTLESATQPSCGGSRRRPTKQKPGSKSLSLIMVDSGPKVSDSGL